MALFKKNKAPKPDAPVFDKKGNREHYASYEVLVGNQAIANYCWHVYWDKQNKTGFYEADRISVYFGHHAEILPNPLALKMSVAEADVIFAATHKALKERKSLQPLEKIDIHVGLPFYAAVANQYGENSKEMDVFIQKLSSTLRHTDAKASTLKDEWNALKKKARKTVGMTEKPVDRAFITPEVLKEKLSGFYQQEIKDKAPKAGKTNQTSTTNPDHQPDGTQKDAVVPGEDTKEKTAFLDKKSTAVGAVVLGTLATIGLAATSKKTEVDPEKVAVDEQGNEQPVKKVLINWKKLAAAVLIGAATVFVGYQHFANKKSFGDMITAKRDASKNTPPTASI